MRSFGRVCLCFDNIAGRGCGTRARRAPRVARGPALIDDSVNTSANIIGYIERPVRPDCDAGGTMDSALGSFHRARETVREDLATSRCACTGEWLEDHVVAT